MFKSNQPKSEFFSESPEPVGTTILPPAAESLLDEDKTKSFWPEEIKNNQELESQAEVRRQLSSQLDSLFNQVPRADMDISQAVESGLIGAGELASLYNELTKFLQDEDHNARLILYLPLEVIPEKNWQPKEKSLAQAINNFSDTYLTKWTRLLQDHDIRANFVGGDILDTERGNEQLLKVNKAAHLIPNLVKKKLISTRQAIQIAEDSSDPILQNSVADALPVLADINLLTTDDLKYMAKSSSNLLNNLAIIIEDNLRENQENQETNENIPEDQNNLLIGLDAKIEQEIKNIEDKYSELTNEMPEARIDWEKQVAKKNIINTYSDQISSRLTNKSLVILDLQEFIKSNDNTNSLLVGINSIRKVAEKTNNTDPKQAKEICIEFESTLRELWDKKIPEIQDALESAWSRWLSLKIIEPKYLDQFDLNISQLDSPFSAKEEKMNLELNELKKITESIENDPELSKFLYPVSIIYGSKVKGYGTKTADMDLAVFIKPNTPLESRQQIQTLLSQTFKHDKIKGQALEFWLKEKGDKLEIQNFSTSDKSLGNSFLTHVLFEGAWCGQNKALKELYEKLLSEYFYAQDKNINGLKSRDIWLKEMERDTLQYRLMHKGYSHFYPEQGGISTKNSQAIDSESTFWDSGYRRLATKLFINKVFLPELKK